MSKRIILGKGTMTGPSGHALPFDTFEVILPDAATTKWAKCFDCAGSGWTGHGMGGDTCGRCGGKGGYNVPVSP